MNLTRSVVNVRMITECDQEDEREERTMEDSVLS